MTSLAFAQRHLRIHNLIVVLRTSETREHGGAERRTAGDAASREHYILCRAMTTLNWKSVVGLIDKCILMGSSSITSFVTWVNHHYYRRAKQGGGEVKNNVGQESVSCLAVQQNEQLTGKMIRDFGEFDVVRIFHFKKELRGQNL
jgi:hypothetical protein